MSQSKFFFIFCLSFLAVACGSGGGGGTVSDNPQENIVEPDGYGVLIDSEVIGISYRSGSLEGITDSEGRFGYLEGETIQFFVGDISVGEAVEPQDRLTPLELAKGNTYVTLAIATFLQSIDDDRDPSNGILIDASVRARALGKELSFTDEGWGEFNFTLCNKQSEGVDGIIYDLTTETSSGSRCAIWFSEAYNHYSQLLHADIDAYEDEIRAIAEESLCDSDDQCEEIILDINSSGSRCGYPTSYIYSKADMTEERLNQLNQSRGGLIDLRLELEDASDFFGYDEGGFCIISEEPYHLVCNENRKCVSERL